MHKRLFRAFHIFAHSGGSPARIASKVANMYVRAAKNQIYDCTINGEFFVLDQLAHCSVSVIFDIGANVGNYSIGCANRFPSARIHAFEIVPDTADKLQQNLGTRTNVIVNRFGLSDAPGVLEINFNPEKDGLSSLVGIGSHADLPGWTRRSVSVKVGDDYCASNDISHIDLLKIDVEGAERQVLDGFKRMFSEHKISVVQFEYGMINIDTKFLLKDIWKFFQERDFVVGAIMPRGVRFKDYEYQDEDFQGPPNYLAVHKSSAALIRSLTTSR
jgi:FkbM family methyltransferase